MLLALLASCLLGGSATQAQIDPPPVTVENLFEVGLGFGMEPLAQLWDFRIPRIGIAFVFGEEFRGVKFSMGFRF